MWLSGPSDVFRDPGLCSECACTHTKPFLPVFIGKYETFSFCYTNLNFWNHKNLFCLLKLRKQTILLSTLQVACMPWSWEGNSSVSIFRVVIVNSTAVGTGVCKYTPYVFLSCVMASLSVALYLRVSSLPKILLLLLLNVLHTVVMETSGYRQAVG